MMAKVGSAEQSCRRELKWRPKSRRQQTAAPRNATPRQAAHIGEISRFFSSASNVYAYKGLDRDGGALAAYRKLVRHWMLSRQQDVS